MWWLWWTAAALAGDPATEVRSALAMGNVREARKAIVALDEALGSARGPVSQEELALRYQAEGALADLLSREKDMLEAFQASWVVAPTGVASPDVLARPDLVTQYAAVQSEVFQRPPIDLRWVELPEAPLRIDGRPQGSQPVFRGRHHIQVMCADGSWSSRWSELKRSENWAHACPDGVLAPLSVVVDDAGAPVTVEVVIDGPMSDQVEAVPENEDDTTAEAVAPENPPASPSREDQPWYAKGVQWVKDFELPRSPKGRLLLGGPVVGLGTGAELQFVPGGDGGGFFTTLGVSHMPLHVERAGVGVVRLTAGELGLGYQPSAAGVPGFEVKGGAAVYHDALLYTDGYLYLHGAAGARWDAPGTGTTLFLGVACVANAVRWQVAPRASLGWQF